MDYTAGKADVLIPAERLQARVRELGAEISRDYAGKNPLLLCILRGGVVFLADLMRCLTIPHSIDFMAIASYGLGARASSGRVRILLDVQQNIENREVLIVEDIIDSGRTLAAVIELLSARRPASLKICALLDKYARREVAVPLAYVGFPIPDCYVFGYGLDIDEQFRHLPFIASARQGQ